MYKAVRSISFALLLTLSAVPMIQAERWGTNPHPPTDDSGSNPVEDAMLFYLGIY